MPGNSYRLTTPTFGIVAEDGQRIPVTIPRGSVITLVDGPPDGDRLIDVTWEDKTVTMFTQDVRNRGERIVHEESRD